MKKKLISFLVLISTFLFIGNVQAIEIDKDDIETGSYVIGTHLFERKVTEHYDGTLTVQHIMLAAQSIGSNDINDMVIYLKNSRGKWVNGLTNESITVPENIKIEYQNTVDITVPSPTLSLIPGVGKEEEGYIEFNNGKYEYDLTINIHEQQYNNWKLYEKNGSNYTLINTIDIGVVMPVYIEAGESKTYVSKLCKVENDKEICSEYSNEIIIDTTKNIIKPELEAWSLGAVDGKLKFDILLKDEICQNGGKCKYDDVDGIEYYEKLSDGSYNLLYSLDAYVVPSIDLDDNEIKNYVARSYVLNKSGIKVYSDYSEELVVDASSYINDVYSYAELEYPQDNLYVDGMYNFYIKLDTDYNYFGAWTLYEVELDDYDNVVSKTPIVTEYTGIPIRVDIDAGQDKKLMAGICLNRSDGNYSNCDYAYTDVDTIDTKDFLITPELTNIGIYGFEEGNILYDLNFNYQDYKIPSLSGYNYTVYGYEFSEVLTDGEKKVIRNLPLLMGGPTLVPYGEVKTFVARVYIEDTQGNRYYSDYSNELVIDTTEYPLLTYFNSGGSNDGELRFEIMYEDYETMDGVELYYNDGYTWNLVDESNIEVVKTEGYYNNYIDVYYDSFDYFQYDYKARLYSVDESGTKKYTDFSPIIDTSYSHDGTYLVYEGSQGSDISGEITFNISNYEIHNMNGVELYYNDGYTWNLVDESMVTLAEIDNQQYVIFNYSDAGYTNYLYKARLYGINSETSEKDYTDFSPIVGANAYAVVPPSAEIIGFSSDNGIKTYSLEIDYNYEFDGLEIYYLSDNEYIWHVYNPEKIETDENSSNIKYIEFDEEEIVSSLKVVMYKDFDNGIRIYTRSSDTISLSVSKPTLSYLGGRGTDTSGEISFAIEHLEIGQMSGAELYYNDGNNWILIDESKVELVEVENEENPNQIVYTYDNGYHIIFKARLYKITSEGTEYTEFSEDIVLNDYQG